MQIMLFPFGSHGDINPFLGVALALRERGHEVTFAACGYFRESVERTGLPFLEWGTAEEYLAAASHPDVWHPLRSFGHLFRNGICPAMRLQYEMIAERAAAGPVLVLANCFGFGARMAQEKLGVPVATVHLQPSVLWSGYETPQLSSIWVGPGVPRWLKNFQFWLGERFVIDRAVCGETNRYRRELGLPPMSRAAHWWNSPECVLGLFPEWFAPPQPDWPANVHLTEFPLWDEQHHAPAQPELEAYLAAGPPPVVFTPGTANKYAAPFFEAAVEACRRTNRRGLLLTRFAEQIPQSLPDGVKHVPFTPLSRLLPRAAALVHPGGVRPLSPAMRAGVPQLIMPMAHDQPDNAARLRRLGLGEALPPSRFRGPAVTESLQRILGSETISQNCRAIAARFEGIDPFATACHVLEEYGARKGLEVSASRSA